MAKMNDRFMIWKRTLKYSIFFNAMLVIWGVLCNSADLPVSKPLKIFVSIPPQRFFVERIGGDRVAVEVLIGSGQSPATYELTPKQMTRLWDADLFFRIGVPFEKILIEKLASLMDTGKIIDTRWNIELRKIDDYEESGHSHYHGHGALDPHIWLNPLLVKLQAETIGNSLVQIDPFNKDYYEENLRQFSMELDALHEEIIGILQPFGGRSFHVFHPAYGYFADAYGLKQVSVESEGKEPTASQLAQLITRAKEEKIKAIFVQPQFSSKSAEVLANQIGARVIVFDPLAEDYLSNLREMADKLAATMDK
jgi:zinc transport system substrate-binding protein